ncbi:hypothetical protein [Moraxella boevrei]|uniref:hypothetical protein n=1 Tax=Faucicola boevrei TaxID=346665 RepID=UPI0037369A87
MQNHQPNQHFRLSQTLYRTILTNLQIILTVFLMGVIIWLGWYLLPMTASNNTYNAENYENALNIVVQNVVFAKDANPISSTTDVTNDKSNQFLANCAFVKPKNQARYQASIEQINQKLSQLFQQKQLANHYAIHVNALWQKACEQQISEKAMAFALKKLDSPQNLQSLQWLEQMPNRNNRRDTSLARLPNNWLTQTNPWYGLSGCVYLKTNKTADNQTGFVYIDTYANHEDNINKGLMQLCNHPELVPMSVKNNPINQPLIANHSQNPFVNIINSQTWLNALQQRQTDKPEQLIPPSIDGQIALPQNLSMMYRGLANIHAQYFDKQLLDAYQDYQQKYDTRNWWQRLTAPPINSIEIDGADIKIGYNMQLTFEPTVQTHAQNIADCMTNSPNVSIDCGQILSKNLQQQANQMYENALVRSIGIAVIDVKTQGILALASSESSCYRQDNGDTRIGAKGCPTLWQKDWSKQALNNHALYQTVYPGSIVKTVQALGLVRANPRLKNQNSTEFNYLKQVMASSSTERVANFLFCEKTTSNMTLARDNNGICQGIPAFKKASDDMGWSANCLENSPHCGFKDLLFGKNFNSDPMLQSRYFSGILLTDSNQDYTAKQLQFSQKNVQSCIRGNGGRMTGACRQGGDTLNAVMNQVFGAGNAKTSVLGASDMFANLLIADNGDKQRRGVHIIDDLWGVHQIPLRPKAWRGDAPSAEVDNLGRLPVRISQSDARATLGLLSGTLLSGTGLSGRNGTAYTACTQAIGNCAWTAGVIVGKTGTPGFNFPISKNGKTNYTPRVTTQMVANACHRADGKVNANICHTRPYKWFVYGLKDKNGKWDKAVAVLVERNFNQKTGVVDDPMDGINRAVQAGVVLAKQLY